MKLAQVKKVSGFETGDGALVVPGKKAGGRGQGSGAGAAAAKDLAKVEKALVKPVKVPKGSVVARSGWSERIGRGGGGAARSPKESAFAFPRPPAAPMARGHGRFMPLRAGSEGRVPLDARPKREAPEIAIAPKRERGRALPREAPARVQREDDDGPQRGGRR